ncbi:MULTISPECIES: MraY family glycosyltransferase [Pseudomonas]|uniref:Glycosyl transferase n=1 Tax=Pseudomonas poae TaxID=200451 RepID=A0AAP2S468_9PSED|nr:MULTISPECIES: glycosyltransferase family 4 protein [Pseudomonas]MCF5657283.1 glycosyl transferase [Pseudomonas poae]MCF5778442.1 glycosyl transferase [Pseudomonas poae]NMZ50242.1 glycosyltransferase family 4 protein [Pseudomonas poae]CRM19977.1 putative undecaprenyl-phosphate N-acetylglucosaminyl 1-phosphate transferase [Pseudomonas sp. 25 E 4]
MIHLLWLAPVVAALALLLTWILRRYALANSMIDIPNARSSHSIPTPRGGGVAIVLSFLIALPILYLGDEISRSVTWALMGAGAAIAILGFLDDHGHIAARWRLLGHFGASIWALFWLGGLPPISLPGMVVDLGWLGHILAAFYLVWLLNLYNFMDGIDGLASIEALCGCLGACLIYAATGNQALIWAPLLLSMAVLGFLYWNFPPARIFMGDAGSGFLGIILGIFSLQAAWQDMAFLWVWLILLGVFVVDATFTLIRRLLRGDKVYEAHRSHAYQFASRQIGGHLPVTLAVLAINLLWLIPIALSVALLGLNGLAGLVIAYIPLVLLAIKYRAGELEKTISPSA